MAALVIVESPTKAKTISKFLGSKFKVESSFGHIRDLPKSKLGVDVEHDFEPTYVTPKDKQKTVTALKTAAKKADEIYFATDEDREGEAISWHLAKQLAIDPSQAKRITFHEITKTAIEEALAHPRTIDLRLVDAQQARRILDRLVGYKLSPLLWKKVARGLSAGRVQSVTVRLVVEREREIIAFIPEEYWSLDAQFATQKKELISASLHAIDGTKLDKLAIKNGQEANTIEKELAGANYHIESLKTAEKKRRPLPPYITSTLQQDANNRLGFSSKETMRLAQQLYEGIELGSDGHVGLITYMRTDSFNLSGKFISEAQAAIVTLFGKEYLAEKTRVFAKKSKGAQEAHEAIRPSDPARTPESVKAHLAPRQFKLYELIWRRAVATQMADARIAQTTIDIANTEKQNHVYTFRASGAQILFDGFLRVYPNMAKELILPPVTEKEAVTCTSLTPKQHFTEPPARYSDATLVKALEERGIGRPSTYAPTIATVEARGYVQRDENKRLQPTDIAMLVNDLLVEHFPEIVDYDFTAAMEGDLDAIAEGTKQYAPVLTAFYGPFAKKLAEKEEVLSKKEVTEEAIDRACPTCNKPMVIKTGRFGRFIACTGYPECKYTEPLDKEEKKMEAEVAGEKCEKCGKDMAMKRGRFGPFLGCSGYPECKNIKAIEKKTGVMCPKCDKGEITEKRSKRGRNFFGCNQYPACDFALWSKPTGEKCPNCQSLLVFGAKGVIRCSNKECGYQHTEESKE